MTSLLALITMLVFIVCAMILAITHSGGYDNSDIAKFFNIVSWLAMAGCIAMTLVLKGVL